MIFHFKAAQNWVAEHYENVFGMIFLFMVTQNFKKIKKNIKKLIRKIWK